MLDIDVQGAAQLKKRIPDAVTIFVLAPSREILEQRLRARSQDTDEVIRRRLDDAAREIRNYSLYDYVLVNEDLDLAAETLKAIVRAERVRRVRVEEKIRPILATFGQANNGRLNKMSDTPARNNAHCSIPDDPDQSTYRFIIVAAKRARQLQGGQRPVLPTSSKKSTVIAMEEARRGLVKYELPADVLLPEVIEEPVL